MSGAASTSDDAAEMMQRLMGFSSFKSTKDTKVPGNEANWGVASPAKEAESRKAEGGSAGGNDDGGKGKTGTTPGRNRRSVEELEKELKRILGVSGPEK
jgi:hypothetical protein